MHLARVGVRVIVLVVDVVCLMLVLSAHVVLLAVCLQFFVAQFSVVGGITLYTPPSVTVNCVGYYRILPL